MALCLPVLSQKLDPAKKEIADLKKFHVGFSLGINTAGFMVVPNSGYVISVLSNPGININLIADYRFSKSWSVRFLPGIQLDQRDLTVANPSTGDTETWKIESSFLNFPILFKHGFWKKNSHSLFFIAGICPRFDIEGTVIPVARAHTSRIIKAFDLYPELGVGFDLSKSKVQIGVELKIAAGMLDIFLNQRDPSYSLFNSGISRIYSRLVILSMHIE